MLLLLKALLLRKANSAASNDNKHVHACSNHAVTGSLPSVVMPFTLGSMIAGRWVFGQVVCDIQAFSFLVFNMAMVRPLIAIVNRRE